MELLLRIILASPSRGVLFCLQGRPGEFFSQTRSADADIEFDVSVRAAPGLDAATPRLFGAVVQGPARQRCIYVCSGMFAGDEDTRWGRRAKIPLSGITTALIGKMKLGGRLTVMIQGTASDGGPACASVKLIGAGWQWIH